jgi:hypothetical protein
MSIPKKSVLLDLNSLALTQLSQLSSRGWRLVTQFPDPVILQQSLLVRQSAFAQVLATQNGRLTHDATVSRLCRERSKPAVHSILSAL